MAFKPADKFSNTVRLDCCGEAFKAVKIGELRHTEFTSQFMLYCQLNNCFTIRLNLLVTTEHTARTSSKTNNPRVNFSSLGTFRTEASVRRQCVGRRVPSLELFPAARSEVAVGTAKSHIRPSSRSTILTLLSCSACQTFSSMVPSATTTIVSVRSV